MTFISRSFIVIVVISIGQNIEQAKREEIYYKSYGYSRKGKPADVQTLEMRNRVRKEWNRLGGHGPNCLNKWPQEYPGGCYMRSKYKNWFKAHLDAQGIPYDDLVLDEVSGVSSDRFTRNINEYNKYHRGWFK